MILLDGQVSDNPLLLDRGLAYGDGLFETIAVRDGELLCWDAHMARLRRGCRVLNFPAPDGERLLDEARQVCAGQGAGVVKLLLTRGSGGRGYRPPSPVQVRRILSMHERPAELDADADAAVATWVCRQRLGHNPALAGIKHLNRLEQVLASAEWPAPVYFEGLMLDLDGHLIEGIRSNLFVVKGGALRTPELSRCGIDGVVREAVLAAAPALGLEVQVAPLTLADVASADELFLCNSVIGVRSVARVDEGHRSITIAGSAITRRLAESLRVANVIP